MLKSVRIIVIDPPTCGLAASQLSPSYSVIIVQMQLQVTLVSLLLFRMTALPCHADLFCR
jgi:hypothetical protein